MIRAAIELGGTAMILAVILGAGIYGFYYWRKAVRHLKREDAADEKETQRAN